MKEIILKIETAEQKSLEEIEKEKKICEQKLEHTKKEAKSLIKNLKQQNFNFYEKEIENFNLELKKEKEEFLKELEQKKLKLEKNLNENLNLAVDAVINEFFNCLN